MNHKNQKITGNIDVEELQLVTFMLGDEEFGVDILLVKEIIRPLQITAVPNSPSYVEGVINLRGTVIPVIDLRRRFSMISKDASSQTRIIVIEFSNARIGFIVDNVSEVLRIRNDTVEPPPPVVADIDSEYISGVGKLKDRLLILLDMKKLINAGEITGMNGF